MDEATKTRKQWGELEKSLLVGKGIDIGCGSDPVIPTVRRFDLEHGDANHITRFVEEDFDFVYSSHCLEHMHDAQAALLEWWKLVRVGGHLIFIVPDEDLYEKGVFPSRFNPDHKATFTISKAESWSPVSRNVLDLAGNLPGGKLVSIKLCDQGYDRRQLRFGRSFWDGKAGLLVWKIIRFGAWRLHRLTGWPRAGRGPWLCAKPNDQTLLPGVLAQIQCIVRKQA
jgi:SAM-dependent methyltransferase